MNVSAELFCKNTSSLQHTLIIYNIYIFIFLYYNYIMYIFILYLYNIQNILYTTIENSRKTIIFAEIFSITFRLLCKISVFYKM